jgi:dienelactone hydrolase
MGRGGLHNSEKRWAQRLNKIGIATFSIDSNKGRRCGNNCYADHQGFPNMVDGYRALELLSSHPNIDPNRIALLGFSVGDHSTLYASMKRFQKMWGAPGLEFAAYVAFYPSCNIIFNEEDVISDQPIRVLHGSLDEWGSAEVSKKYVDRLQAAGNDIIMTIFPGAHHSFDMKMERPIIVKGWGHVNCHFIENDELGDHPLKVSQVGYDKNEHKKTYKMGALLMYDKSCGTKKARIEYNEEVAKKSIKIVTDFFVSIFKLSS